ncbi:unnamed protein product [Rotaria sordida]|uniref:Uncharacterized protein n=1 Tax=Rotaria sordida TaxID=392033 RepID=A0A819APF4_9BILA|nr:unnamed protein product [Rotaria sordida]
MVSNPLLPPDLSTFLNRFSKDELYQIGLTIIQQSQYPIQLQQQIHHPGPSQLTPRRLSRPTRPSLENVSSIPRLMNHQSHCSIVRPLMEQQTTPVSSTPRRPASDSFDNSGGNRNRLAKHPRNNDHPPHYELIDQQHHPILASPHHQQHAFNLNILKHAVSNNLPSFFIIFDSSIDPSSIPSSIQVAIMLKKLFTNNQLPIKDLSMCVQAGARRFKFAVSDKADFLTLFNWTWPLEIEDKKFEVIKSRSLPDCLALVVRYVPSDIKQETARQQILKAIPAAVGFSTINYRHRQNSSYDIRFNVRSLEQYQTAPDLGRLAIGRHYLTLTSFYSGYRLTYCTACWKIGHMRTLASGAIKRPSPGELFRPYLQHANDFPVLNQAQVSSHPD